MGGEDEGGDHTEVEGEGEREDRLDRVQLQYSHTLVVGQGHLHTSSWKSSLRIRIRDPPVFF